MKTRFTLTLTLLLAFTLTLTPVTAQQYVLTKTVNLGSNASSITLLDDNNVIFEKTVANSDNYPIVAWDISRDRQRWEQDVGKSYSVDFAVPSHDSSLVAYGGSGSNDIRLRLETLPAEKGRCLFKMSIYFTE